MKKNAPKLLVIALSLTTLLGTTSCEKDESIVLESLETEVTEEEAVEIIEASLQAETSGLAETTKTTTEELDSDIEFDLNCDTLIEKSYPFNFESNNVQANFNVNWSYEIACNGAGVPQTAEFSSQTNGSYTTPRINSNDSSTGQFSISGLQPTATAFLMSGSYSREGTQTISFNERNRNITSNLSANLTNLLIDKSDYRIDAGEGAVQLTVINLENTINFQGSIVFNGNGEATLTINGNPYIIVIN